MVQLHSAIKLIIIGTFVGTMLGERAPGFRDRLVHLPAHARPSTLYLILVHPVVLLELVKPRHDNANVGLCHVAGEVADSSLRTSYSVNMIH